MIELWELRGLDDARYSTFAWRTRLALLHKGVEFATHAVEVTDKAAIAFSGQGKVPIIRHGDTIVSDSWAIARYLEREFPDRPSLFGGETGEGLAHFFNLWVDRELLPLVVPPLMLDVLACVTPADAAHHRTQMEKALKRPLEELHQERERSLADFRRRTRLLHKVLDGRPFIGGESPAYADLVLFSVPQWVRIVSLERLFEPGDPLADWFERMLDAYCGAGRLQPSRAERMGVADR